MHHFKNILFDSLWVRDLEEFEDLVVKAKDSGVTHIGISRLSRRTEFVDKDIMERNPWSEWSIIAPSVFKHYQPSELEGVYDKDFVREQMDLLKKKHEIVTEHGLKSFYSGQEPLWLPNKVYIKHPNWRGARGDNSLRTTDLLYAPCVDQPEVLELYRKAVYEIVKAAPSIEIFTFATDDAGAMMCWTERLYAGVNGPTWCAGRNMGDRIAGFLKTVGQGALDAGVNARAYLASGLSKFDATSLISKLEPGIGIGLASGIATATVPADLKECFMGWTSGWSPWNTMVNKLPYPLFSLHTLDASYRAGCETIAIGWYLGRFDPAVFTLLRVFNEAKPSSFNSLKGKIDLVMKVAAVEFAPEVSEDVMEAWYEINVARDLVQSLSSEIYYQLPMGAFANRWLVRPILGTQHKLAEEELAYCKRWIYQMKPEGYKDYLKAYHRRCAESWAHARDIGLLFETAKTHLTRAASLFLKAKEKVADPRLKQKLELNALRADAQRCLLTNVSNTIQLGVLSYERERYTGLYTEETDPFQPSWDLGSRQLQVIYTLQRSELDNTNELINILKASPEPLIVSSLDKSQEGFFMYGPDLIDQLKKKIELMLKHWRDVDELYFRPMRGT
jgi:hypothetical protein